MLVKLTIKNYALIDEVTLDFTEGLSILTGETGAGKSVIMGAIGLLSGDRIDSRVLTREGKSVIEAWFKDVPEGVKPLFDHYDLDWGNGEVIIRREISRNGRSRAFVNDTPVVLPVLDELSRHMVDVHSQNANRLLSSSDHQRWIIDSMADNANLREEYKNDFRRYVELRSRLRKIRENMQRSKENREMLEFQVSQLDALNLRKGELAEIEKRFDILSDADELKEKLSHAYSLLDDSEISAMPQIWEALGSLTAFPELHEALNTIYVELADLVSTIESKIPTIESDPLELNRLTNRMHELYEAQKRFRVSECDALIQLRDDLRSQLDNDATAPEELAQMEEETLHLAASLREQANLITESRRNAAAEFAKRLTLEARPLGLKNLKFEIDLQPGKLTADGQDTVEFLCCFNKNQPLMPMAKIASGGEMARLTLTIKAMLADKLKLPTVIFDEIDTGVSGEIADRMGEMMTRVAADMQVLAITHLPQVAAKGSSHYLVYKTDLADRTVTEVKKLSFEERVSELARMLSGRKLNEAALRNARSLLTNE